MKTLTKEMETINSNFELYWFSKKEIGKRTRSSLLLVSEQNELGGSSKKAWRRTADRLPNQQVLPETRTKKGGVNGSYGKRTS